MSGRFGGRELWALIMQLYMLGKSTRAFLAGGLFPNFMDVINAQIMEHI